MDNEIKQFQKQNGNVTYTVKELLAGLHTKIDKIDERTQETEVKLSNMQGICVARGRMMKIGFPLICSAMAGILLLIIGLHT